MHARDTRLAPVWISARYDLMERDPHRAERQVHRDDDDEHDAGHERVVHAGLRGAPAVRVELSLRALAQLALHRGEEQAILFDVVLRRLAGGLGLDGLR